MGEEEWFKRNGKLFDKLVKPKIPQIRGLVQMYVDNYQELEPCLSYVLEQLYKYIHTYDESKSLDTWLHIVTKRSVFNQNKEEAERLSYYTDTEIGSYINLKSASTSPASILDNISDEVYDALLQVSPIKLSAFLLQLQGYSIKEIVKIESERGHFGETSKLSVEIIKNRIHYCKKKLKRILEKNGIRPKKHTDN